MQFGLRHRKRERESEREREREKERERETEIEIERERARESFSARFSSSPLRDNLMVPLLPKKEELVC